RFSQSHMCPVVPSVSGLVNAVTYRRAVTRPGLSGADPDGLRVLAVNRERANRLDRLLVEHGLVGGAAVHRFPDTAGSGPDATRQPLPFLEGIHRGTRAVHGGRANIART